MTRRPLQASGAAFITGCVSIPASVPVVAADGAGPVSTLELFAGFSGAASTAAAFVSAASSSAPDGGLKMRLAREPRGACIGGRIWGLTSDWTALISDSIWERNSFEARRNSFMMRPIWRPISGSFLGPKRISARKKRKIISPEKPKFIVLMINAREEDDHWDGESRGQSAE